MAVAGELPDQASWALALWHGLLLLLLLLALDGWGRQLHSPRLAILALIPAAITPGLASLRVNFTLDLALTAVTTLALWQLWRWQRPTPHGGGRWVSAMLAAFALAAALLVKQSVIPVLAAPWLWAVATGIGQRRRRPQLLAGMALVLALILPWLHQNWITAIGGTHRAVVISAESEGDPPVFSLASLLYYPRLWRQQLGALPWLAPVAGLALALGRHLRRGQSARIALPEGWGWLLGCTISGWLLTTMSPNAVNPLPGSLPSWPKDWLPVPKAWPGSWSRSAHTTSWTAIFCISNRLKPGPTSASPRSPRQRMPSGAWRHWPSCGRTPALRITGWPSWRPCCLIIPGQQPIGPRCC